MTHFSRANLALGIMLAALPAARADTTCPPNPTTGSTVGGNLIVTGTCSLDNVTVGGNVQVETGATLVVSGGTIDGNVRANRCFFTALVNNVAVGGNVQIQDCTAGSSSTGKVLASGYTGNSDNLIHIGGNFQCSGAFFCAAEFGKVEGNIRVDGDSEADIVSNSVGGNVQVNDNTNASVSDNTIGGNLQCEANAGIAGGDNTVHGNKQGQCAGF